MKEEEKGEKEDEKKTKKEVEKKQEMKKTRWEWKVWRSMTKMQKSDESNARVCLA